MNDLVNRIANGEATLLGVDEICKRLGVSRSTFERWVRNGIAKTGGAKTGGVDVAAMLSAALSRAHDQKVTDIFDGVGNKAEEALTFPAPDIRIGNSPKWEMATFKRWLAANMTS